jgi:UDP-3-O-[3-hydroxymyristoyl] N-acetylglucosamine deacetylase
LARFGEEVLETARFKGAETTVRTPASCAGIGLHSGKPARLTLLPAEPDTGVVFRRTDLTEASYVAARYDNVAATELGTTLRNAAGVSVATVEHLMAALSMLGVDNVVVELDGPEVPIMDGSSAAFVALIERAGLKSFAVPRKFIRVLKPVEICEGEKRAALLPHGGFSLSFEIEFKSPVVGRQALDAELGALTFRREIAPARTFGFLEEVELLRARGLALGGSLDNAIVIDGTRMLNTQPLRFADEFVRHKMLDAAGDLALAGAPLMARYVGRRSGHELNNRLLRALFADPAAWRFEGGSGPRPAAIGLHAAVGP